ncbi:MAG: type II toxin-antitoxin system RelE/ParE family toxin [Planctomycetales bacterium]|nr:type II toxin-antitoxin system RelE/ParE family toxin [Planctomycetales bacterium]
MSFRVTVTSAAASDFEGCFNYIAGRSPRGAAALREAFGKTVKSLEQDALAHGFAPESDDHRCEIRQVLFRTSHGRNYRALYLIDNDHVSILHVRGPGQDVLLPDELKLP